HNTTPIVHNTTALVLPALLIVAGHGPPGPAQQAGATIAIRVNQVGYLPAAPKVAVVCALEPRPLPSFRVVDAGNRTVFGPVATRATGPFGPCATTYRLDFSGVRETGVYWIVAGDASSLPVRVGRDVYQGAADSLLAYLREQRSGYNPVFRDSVHQHTDGILVDHPTRSSEFIPVSGGWADASDYLQYGATTAHATAMLLLAYREHPAAVSALGAAALRELDTAFARRLAAKARAVYALGAAHPGVCQTAPARAPYFYEEDDWADDMELGAVELYALTHEAPYLTAALRYAALEPVTPWMGQDTARHYQWYPWHNNGHYESWREGPDSARRLVAGYYGRGLAAVARRADSGFRVGSR